MLLTKEFKATLTQPGQAATMVHQLPSRRDFRTRKPMVWLVALLLVLILTPLMARPGHTAKLADSYFGSREIRRDGLAPFPKWQQALDRHFKEKASLAGRCESNRYNRCHARKWQALVDSAQPLSPRRQVEVINGFMNRSPYIVDPINWGVKDYWESPGQFLSRNGDCEDYAIAKYLTLRRLGFATDAMRIVVLQDTNLKIPHAVLVVTLDGKTLVLDNQIRRVVEARRIRHYQAIYSVNERNWWMHIPAR